MTSSPHSRAVLVAGGAGYIGSHACKALAGAGYLPVTLDNLSTGHAAFVQWGPFFRGELANAPLVRGLVEEFEIDAVMIFAARTESAESVAHPQRYFQTNVADTLVFLEAAMAAGVERVVFSSSAAVYGAPRTVPANERAPLKPINPYGESKKVIEEALARYSREGVIRHFALRYFNAAGADPASGTGEWHRRESHLIPNAIFAALGFNEQFVLHGGDFDTPDGSAIRDFVHVADLANAHVLALDRLIAGGRGGALNLGTGRGVSVRQVVAAVETATGRSLAPQLAPRRPGDAPRLVADASEARHALGWRPERSSLHEIVGSAVEFYEKFGVCAPAGPVQSARRWNPDAQFSVG